MDWLVKPRHFKKVTGFFVATEAMMGGVTRLLYNTQQSMQNRSIALELNRYYSSSTVAKK